MQQQYGQPPPPGQPPHGGYAPPPTGAPAYGAPATGGPGYGAPPHGAPVGAVPDPQLADLENQSTTWLIVGLAGFVMGFSWITGPLAWIYGSKIRNQYRLRGMPPHGNATAAWIIGIVSTGLYALAFIGILLMFLVFAGAVAAST